MSLATQKTSVLVSSKGQVTLPASMRKALGLTGDNAFVTIEQKGGKLVLTPAIVVETEIYSDEDIARWEREDRFAPGEREALNKALKRRASRR